MRVISRLASIFGRKKARRGLRVAVILDHGEVSVAGIRDGHVVAVTSAPCAEEHALNAVVNAFCTEHDLHGAAATVIPAANEYQLLLVEAPPVPAAELAD
ncbi:hypothetical protein GYB62_02035, partial [bacterium]|nr:hypothetical protein [bacterium]